MAGEKERVEGYLATVERLEPDIHPIDASAFYASAAISLRRIADAAEKRNRLLLARALHDDLMHEDWLRRHGFGDLLDDGDKT